MKRSFARSAVVLACVAAVTCGPGWSADATEPPAAGAGAVSPPMEADFLRTLVIQHFVPAVERFSETSSTLVRALDRACTAPDSGTLVDARGAWAATAHAWDELDAVEFGPVLDRRSFFQIDFWPTRPIAIDSMVNGFPESARTLDVVSSAAKGLPALEYLLWPHAPGAPVLQPGKQCDFARLLAGGIHAEAGILETGYRAMAAEELDAPRAKERLALLVNQVFGGVESLRGKASLRPSATRDPRLFPRHTSGETVRYWSARWSALRRLLVGAQAPGVTSLTRHLRDKGETDAAERLQSAVASTEAVMQGLQSATAEAAGAAAAALATTEQSLTKDVAPALHVTIGFRGGDGD